MHENQNIFFHKLDTTSFCKYLGLKRVREKKHVWHVNLHISKKLGINLINLRTFLQNYGTW